MKIKYAQTQYNFVRFLGRYFTLELEIRMWEIVGKCNAIIYPNARGNIYFNLIYTVNLVLRTTGANSAISISINFITTNNMNSMSQRIPFFSLFPSRGRSLLFATYIWKERDPLTAKVYIIVLLLDLGTKGEKIRKIYEKAKVSRDFSSSKKFRQSRLMGMIVRVTKNKQIIAPK